PFQVSSQALTNPEENAHACNVETGHARYAPSDDHIPERAGDGRAHTAYCHDIERKCAASGESEPANERDPKFDNMSSTTLVAACRAADHDCKPCYSTLNPVGKYVRAECAKAGGVEISQITANRDDCQKGQYIAHNARCHEKQPLAPWQIIFRECFNLPTL